MPSFLGTGKQHNTEDANSSRLVTKIRWVIESARIKKWKYFSNVLINKNIHTIKQDFMIICAIINKYRPQLASTDDEDQIDLFKKMLAISQKSNQFIGECSTFKKRILKRNRRLDPDMLDFPVLTEEYIERLTFGVYQLKQAKSYTAEHLDENNNYMFEIFPVEGTDVIHVKLRSRFASQTIHDIWIRYDPVLRLTEGQCPILNWYLKT